MAQTVPDVAPQTGAETELEVVVPRSVAEQAKASLDENGRLRAGYAFHAPVLILEGLELGQGEGITFQVLGPAQDGTKAPVLSVTGMVGRRQSRLQQPLSTVDLVIPLNERSLALLAGGKTVKLVLKITNNPERPPLKVRALHLDVDAQGSRGK